MTRLSCVLTLIFVSSCAIANPIQFNVDEASLWRPVNDTVMGGRSWSRFSVIDDVGVFEGGLSLANNGGFASVRRYSEPAFKNGGKIALLVKGDGRKYQFRLKSTQIHYAASYVAEFQTEKDQWQVIELSEYDFVAKFRGRYLTGVAPLQFSQAMQIAILIGDKNEGRFRLEIKSIDFLQEV